MALRQVRKPAIRLRRVTEVGADDDVVHVDQLSAADFEAVVAGRTGQAVTPDELDPGDVVVFTDYYRVEVA